MRSCGVKWDKEKIGMRRDEKPAGVGRDKDQQTTKSVKYLKLYPCILVTTLRGIVFSFVFPVLCLSIYLYMFISIQDLYLNIYLST